MSNAARSRRAFLRRWLIFLILLPVIAVVFLMLFENRLVYPLSTAAEAWLEPPANDVEDVWFTSADGTKLHGWFFPVPAPCDVFVLSHGNGGNLSHRGRTAVELRKVSNRAVLLFDYPGYGKSQGSPTEEGCYAAGDAAISWLKSEKNIRPAQMILFGESLGGGVATELAIRHEHKALVLTKTFTSLPAAAKNLYPMLPTNTLMRNRYESLNKISRVMSPVFIAHGTADELVPFSHAEQLFAAANEPKQLHRLEGQTHNAWLTSDFYFALKAFLDTHTK